MIQASQELQQVAARRDRSFHYLNEYGLRLRYRDFCSAGVKIVVASSETFWYK
jgi:hypothetical protein